MEYEHEISVRLNRIEDLFAEPAGDPFDPDSRYRTGMDELLEQVYGMRGQQIKVVVELPANDHQSGDQKQAGAAFGRYCRAQIDELERTLRDHWRTTRRQLVTAFAILLVIALEMAFVLTADFLPDVVKALVAFISGVFAYATFWGPADLVLYAWRPYRTDLQRYRLLINAGFEIRARD